MRRRLDLAASLVGRPEVIFLDEPTTVLDPAKREDMWEVVRTLVPDGSTVLLTTQYLEEADALADEITVFDHGRVIAHDTPEGLKRIVGGQTLEVRPADVAQLEQAAPPLPPPPSPPNPHPTPHPPPPAPPAPAHPPTPPPPPLPPPPLPLPHPSPPLPPPHP